MKTLTAFVLLLGVWALRGFEIDSTWRIVCPADALPTERKAAADTAEYIKKVAGLELKIVPEAEAGRPAIIVKKNPQLPDEAWDVRRVPEGLLISGGVPNGMLYACGEFLEHGLGCRFLAFDVTFIPKKEKLILPDDFKRSGKPFFAGRSIYRGQVKGTTEFSVRSKQNGGIYAGPEWGWYDRVVNNQGCHTFYLYSSRFPADKPEWLSLSKSGERLRGIKGSGPGQLCLTQPASRDFIFREMLERIYLERKSLKKSGRPYSKIIDLSANDTTQKCVCPGCLAAEKKYGTYSGVLLEFINDLAERLEIMCPDMMIQTFAYEFTEQAPPAGRIAPRKNVLIQLAQLGGEYHSSTKVKRDSLRPLSHANNKVALNEFLGWSKFGTPLKMWDYWVLYDQRRNFPYTVIPSIAPNLRFYAENHVTRIFAESELVMGKRLLSGQCFRDLTWYLGAKLMVDPFADEQAIIDDFMRHYYGPAAGPMRRLLTYLGQAMETESANLGVVGIGASYLTEKFFADTEKLFAEAEALAKDDPAVLARIGEERISYDEAALDLQSKLNLTFDREKVLKRYRENYRKAFARFGNEPYVAKWKGKLEEHLDIIGKQIPVPPQFARMQIYDFPFILMMNNEAPYTKVLDDPEAAGGKASILKAPESADAEKKKAFHEKNFQGGVYSPSLKKGFLDRSFTPDEMFKDEKYHWYCLGETKLAGDCYIWLHWSWRMSFKCLSSVYSEIEPDAVYQIWASVKLQGPAYAPGSQKENAVIVDRIIVVKPLVKAKEDKADAKPEVKEGTADAKTETKDEVKEEKAEPKREEKKSSFFLFDLF